jgi:myosin heavy subunit
METVRIRKEGYAERMVFRDFFERYKGIYFEPSVDEDLTLASKCRRILLEVGSATAGEFQIGHTKVFLTHTMEQKLLLRLKVHATRCCISLIVLNFFGQIQYYRKHGEVLINAVRCFLAKKELRQLKASQAVRIEIFRNHNEFLVNELTRLSTEKELLLVAIQVEMDRKQAEVQAKLRAEQEVAAAAEAKRRAEEQEAEEARQAAARKAKFAAPLSELERKLAQAKVISFLLFFIGILGVEKVLTATQELREQARRRSMDALTLKAQADEAAQRKVFFLHLHIFRLVANSFFIGRQWRSKRSQPMVPRNTNRT